MGLPPIDIIGGYAIKSIPSKYTNTTFVLYQPNTHNNILVTTCGYNLSEHSDC